MDDYYTLELYYSYNIHLINFSAISATILRELPFQLWVQEESIRRAAPRRRVVVRRWRRRGLSEASIRQGLLPGSRLWREKSGAWRAMPADAWRRRLHPWQSNPEHINLERLSNGAIPAARLLVAILPSLRFVIAADNLLNLVY